MCRSQNVNLQTVALRTAKVVSERRKRGHSQVPKKGHKVKLPRQAAVTLNKPETNNKGEINTVCTRVNSVTLMIIRSDKGHERGGEH